MSTTLRKPSGKAASSSRRLGGSRSNARRNGRTEGTPFSRPAWCLRVHARDGPTPGSDPRPEREDGRAPISGRPAHEGRGTRPRDRVEGGRDLPRLRRPVLRGLRRRRDAGGPDRPPRPRADAAPPVQPGLLLRSPGSAARLLGLHRCRGAPPPEPRRAPDDDPIPPLAPADQGPPRDERARRPHRGAGPAGRVRRPGPRTRVPHRDGRRRRRRRLPVHRHGGLPSPRRGDPRRQAWDRRGPRTRDRPPPPGGARPRAPATPRRNREGPRCPDVRHPRVEEDRPGEDGHGPRAQGPGGETREAGEPVPHGPRRARSAPGISRGRVGQHGVSADRHRGRPAVQGADADAAGVRDRPRRTRVDGLPLRRDPRVAREAHEVGCPSRGRLCMATPRLLAGIVLYSKDLDRARAFYRDVMGLPILLEEAHVIHFDAGSVRLAIHRYPTGEMTGAPEGFLVFAVPDLDAAYAELGRRGAEFLGPPATRPYGKVAYLRDPEGHEIGLLQEPSEGSDGFRRVGPLVQRFNRIVAKLSD